MRRLVVPWTATHDVLSARSLAAARHPPAGIPSRSLAVSRLPHSPDERRHSVAARADRRPAAARRSGDALAASSRDGGRTLGRAGAPANEYRLGACKTQNGRENNTGGRSPSALLAKFGLPTRPAGVAGRPLPRPRWPLASSAWCDGYLRGGSSLSGTTCVARSCPSSCSLCPASRHVHCAHMCLLLPLQHQHARASLMLHGDLRCTSPPLDSSCWSWSL